MTGFSAEWEKAYRDGGHKSTWPWSDLVSLVMRHAPTAKRGLRVLELGAGAGANIPFFRQLGMEYHAIEGSISAVEDMQRRFPDIAKNISPGDFTRTLHSTGEMDLVVDRSSLTHNSTEDIRRTINLIWQCLKPGGLYIGIDWFSVEHSSFALEGGGAEDQNTRLNLTGGPMGHLGRVHFSDSEHLRELFSRFDIRLLRHKISEVIIPDGRERLAWYDLVCAKEI